VFNRAKDRISVGRGTLLFIDEIHRFNRAQQDGFLPYVEDGTVVLVGATTENPSFELNSALLSRAQVLVLNRLSDDDMDYLLSRAEAKEGKTLQLDTDARSALRSMADGDGRYLLNMTEEVFALPSESILDTKALAIAVQKRMPLYDKSKDGHYNLISALHKSLRGSDVDAALYWFARMLAGGEDLNYILRRLVRFASEDIGMADPQALTQSIAAWEAFDRLGSPEGELTVAQCIIYLATAPKSNATYKGEKDAKRLALETGSLVPPKHILNAPTKLMSELGYGDGYAYDHDSENNFSGQNYFPDEIQRSRLYNPGGKGFENEIVRRLEYWNKLRREKGGI
jgi:putative ATPase